MVASSAALDPVERTSILFVDPGIADLHIPALRTHYEVSAVSSADQAIRAMRSFQPTLVITELALADGSGLDVCRHSKAFPANAPLVLAITAVPDLVPDALIAGCDGVLLKPFAPNLLYTRIGRLLRQRANTLLERAPWQRVKATQRIERAQHLVAGTNVIWHDAYCPSCGKGDVVSFDTAGNRRAWYACLPCRKVWLAPARDGLQPSDRLGKSPSMAGSDIRF